jgi:hypothetical protein
MNKLDDCDVVLCVNGTPVKAAAAVTSDRRSTWVIMVEESAIARKNINSLKRHSNVIKNHRLSAVGAIARACCAHIKTTHERTQTNKKRKTAMTTIPSFDIRLLP